MQNVSVKKQIDTFQVHSIEEVPALLQALFSIKADELAMTTGFIQRKRKLTGSSYLKSLVFGWLNDPKARLKGLAQSTVRAGTPVKPQSLDERFGEKSVAFLKASLENAFKHRVKASPVELEAFKHFKAIRIADSSIISLPIECLEEYRGCGNQNKKSSSLKLQANMELLSGELILEIQQGFESDHTSEVAFTVAVDELSIRDLGYFGLRHFIEINAAGGYFLTRVPSDQIFYNLKGQHLERHAWLVDGFDQMVCLGSQQLAVRLVVMKVPESVRLARVERIKFDAKKRMKPVSQSSLLLAGWDVRITNADALLLPMAALFIISRLRWQIELFFKLCKSLNLVDESRSSNPNRVLTEVFAKLLACLVQHWCVLASAWEMPERSLFRMAMVIQTEAIGLLRALIHVEDIRAWLANIRCVMKVGCSIERRKKKPSAFQLLKASNA